jgi:hypothetical protein
MIAHDPNAWARAMAFQIRKLSEKTGELYHRWFDGGDLANVAMLRAIVLTCELTPEFRHWLATREAKVVKDYLKTYGAFPSNLVVRVSAAMIDDAPMAGHMHTSTVVRAHVEDERVTCKAKMHGVKKNGRWTGAKCGSCRACWDPAVANVSYPLH